MNLRCTYCQTPFTVSRMEKLAALQRMQAENLHHYDAICPRCRRANSVSRQRLEMFTPGWREGLKSLEAEAARLEKEALSAPPLPVETAAPIAAVPAPVLTAPTVAPVAKKRHTARPKAAAPASTKPAVKAKPAPTKAKIAVKKATVKAKPVKKTVAKAKPAAKKPATKAKKPAATKAKPAVKKPTTKAKKPAGKKK